MRRLFTDYIFGSIMLALMPIRWPKFDGNAVGSIGKVCFFGPIEFVDDCLKAINEDLSKYDPSLKQELLDRQAYLYFYRQEGKHQFAYDSVALYAIPDHIVRYKSEGLCQYIIYRYFQTLELGKGPIVALKCNPKDHIESMFRIKSKMVEWLIKTNYPARWKEAYKWKTI